MKHPETATLQPHDVPMNRVVTPTRTVRTGAGAKPSGLRWDVLSAERVESIPLLERLRD